MPNNWLLGVLEWLKSIGPWLQGLAAGYGISEYVQTKQEVKRYEKAAELEKNLDAIPVAGSAGRLRASKYNRSKK